MKHQSLEKLSSSRHMISIKVCAAQREQQSLIKAESGLPAWLRIRQSVMRMHLIFEPGSAGEAARRDYLQRHCYRDEKQGIDQLDADVRHPGINHFHVCIRIEWPGKDSDWARRIVG